MNSGVPCLAIVVPCFNEEEVLPETAKRLGFLLSRLVYEGQIAETSHVCFVDDGSSDRTWQIIQELQDSTASTSIPRK